MSMSVGLLDHFNIRTRKLSDTVRFYEDVLGLEKGARPNFAFPGAWMYSEGKPVVHLVDILSPRGGGVRGRETRWCISSIFRGPTSNRNPTPALSIMSPSRAADLP